MSRVEKERRRIPSLDEEQAIFARFPELIMWNIYRTMSGEDVVIYQDSGKKPLRRSLKKTQRETRTRINY